MKYFYGGHIPREKGQLIKTLEKLKTGGGNTLQFFAGSPYNTKNRDKEIAVYKEQSTDVKAYLEEHQMKIFIHSAYTLNFSKSALEEHPYWSDILWGELQIADILNAEGCVLHMGKAVKKDIRDAETNMHANLVSVIDKMRKNNVRAKIIIETAAGQGTEIFVTRNNNLDPLARLYNMLSDEDKPYIKFCVDTCHIFAAGYDISSKEKVERFFNEWDQKIGVGAIAVCHLNNSSKDLGSGVDRHACLAYGKIAFEGIVSFAITCYKLGIPVILETPAPYQELEYLVQFEANLD